MASTPPHSRIRMRYECLIFGTIVCLSLASACTEPEASVLSHSVRDSAGVEIVENGAPAWSRSQEWRISEEPLFVIHHVIHASDGSQENLLLDPASVDVDSRGRIIVADGDQAGWDAVLVFDSLGTPILKMGGEGQGPGEFGQLWWASTYRGDSVAAFDMARDKVAIFDPEGQFVREVLMPQIQTARPAQGTYGYTAGMNAAFANGDFLAYPFGSLDISEGPGPAWYRHLLLRLSPEGEAWDTLGEFEIHQQYWSGTNQEQLWYAPAAVTVVWEDQLYFGKGDSFELRLHDRNGQLIRIIRRAHEPLPVTERDKDLWRQWFLELLEQVSTSPEVNEQILEDMRQDMETARFAETIPPYSAALVDPDGNLWIEEFRWYSSNSRAPVLAPAHWSVFDSTGLWLGTVQTPPGLNLRTVRTDRVLGFVVDEFDVQEIHVHRLTKPER